MDLADPDEVEWLFMRRQRPGDLNEKVETLAQIGKADAQHHERRLVDAEGAPHPLPRRGVEADI